MVAGPGLQAGADLAFSPPHALLWEAPRNPGVPGTRGQAGLPPRPRSWGFVTHVKDFLPAARPPFPQVVAGSSTLFFFFQSNSLPHSSLLPSRPAASSSGARS